MARRAWITGAGGLIGSHLVQAAPKGSWEIRALTRQQLDLCDLGAVERAFRADEPALVIHCAALTKNPVCQAKPASAWRINTQATEHLAKLAAEIPFVFFSTDLVFDGEVGQYDESAHPHPLTVYAETKAAAERIVLANPGHTVIRTSLNAGASPTRDRGLDEQLRVAWERGETTRLFTDEFRSPIPAEATARAVWELVAQGQRGLFHVAGAQRLSRWEIGRLVAPRYAHLHPRIEPASLKDYTGPPRSPDTSLNCQKIQARLSFRLPGFGEWLSMPPQSLRR